MSKRTLYMYTRGGQKLKKFDFELALKLPPFSWSPSKNIKISSQLTWEVLPLEAGL